MKIFRISALIATLTIASLASTTPPAPSTVSVLPRLDSVQMRCLAKNIYYEAPDESYEGKLAIATVTMNRLRSKSFPKTICGVVYEHSKAGCQFSWTCGRRAPFNRLAFKQSEKIAIDVLTKNVRLVSIKNALYFHNTSVLPKWEFAHPIKKIGNHIFYVVNTYGHKTNTGPA